jgi:3-hydroxyisobutyrate dehydrogenase-like beta-hydroxyacid dehydrogenase
MEETRDLAELGAEVAETAGDAARRAAIVLTMVTDADAVTSIARDQGMLAALAPGAIWVQMSTIGVAGIDRVAAMVGVERPDVMLLDAPVSGSKDPAEHGQLTIFASGPGEARACRCAVRRAWPAHDLGRRGRGGNAPEAREQHLARVRGRSGCHIRGTCAPAGS